MTLVFTFWHYDYEDTEMIGVFSSMEKCKEYINKIFGRIPEFTLLSKGGIVFEIDYERYGIESYQIDKELELSNE